MSKTFEAGVADGIKTASAGMTRFENARELVGLGLIAAPVVDNIQLHLRHKKPSKNRELVHHVSDVAGLGALSYPYAKELLKKQAGGGAASPGGTGSSPTTSGEMEREISAPGVSGSSYSQLEMRERAEPGAKSGRGRGLPEWARHLTRQNPAEPGDTSRKRGKDVP